MPKARAEQHHEIEQQFRQCVAHPMQPQQPQCKGQGSGHESFAFKDVPVSMWCRISELTTRCHAKTSVFCFRFKTKTRTARTLAGLGLNFY